jgi:hypothetical protein
MHPNFRLLVLQELPSEASDIEIKQPAPFLNRFEKYRITFNDCLPERSGEICLQIKNSIFSALDGIPGVTNLGPETMLFNYNHRMLQFQVMHNLNSFEVVDDVNKQYPLNSLVHMFSFSMFLWELIRLENKPDLQKQMIETYLNSHPYENLDALLQKRMLKQDLEKYLIFTRSNLSQANLTGGYMKDVIKMETINQMGQAWLTRTIEAYLSDVTKHELVLYVEKFKYWKNISVIQRLIDLIIQKQAASIRTPKTLVLLINYNKKIWRDKQYQNNQGICLWDCGNDWNSIAIDSLIGYDLLRVIEEFEDKTPDFTNVFDEGLLKEVIKKMVYQKEDLEDLDQFEGQLLNFYFHNEVGKRIKEKFEEKFLCELKEECADWRIQLIENNHLFNEGAQPREMFRVIQRKKMLKKIKQFLFKLENEFSILRVYPKDDYTGTFKYFYVYAIFCFGFR